MPDKEKRHDYGALINQMQTVADTVTTVDKKLSENKVHLEYIRADIKEIKKENPAQWIVINKNSKDVAVLKRVTAIFSAVYVGTLGLLKFIWPK